MTKKKSNSVAEAPGGELPDGTPYPAATMTADGVTDQSPADRMPEYGLCVNCSIRSQDGDQDHLCDHCRQEAAMQVMAEAAADNERKKVSRPRTNPVQFWVARLDEYGYPKALIVRTKSVRSAGRKLEEYSRALGIPLDSMGVLRVKPVKPKSDSDAAA